MLYNVYFPSRPFFEIEYFMERTNSLIKREVLTIEFRYLNTEVIEKVKLKKVFEMS